MRLCTNHQAAAAFAFAFAFAAAGCGDPTFTPRTFAPPGAVAEYREDKQSNQREIRLTEGVAMAIECTDDKGHPCTLDGTYSEDENIAGVKRAYGALDQKLTYDMRERSYESRALFVVIGRQAGATKLLVRTGRGDVTMNVETRAP